ncbi:DUF222 domain-containing protein [Microbacterium sp. R86528]|uniref:HNH endonuclease signature motif containing protein n=1 Tax=Microbacterium sp. R86528 TaxID=3093864 RepID=UPI0037C7F36F
MHSNGVIGFTDADSAELVELVAQVEQTQRAIAAAQAAQTRALARAGNLARKQCARASTKVRDHDMALRAIAAEVAGVMHTSDRSVQRQIGDAIELVEDYPETLGAWGDGVITRAHVRVIADTGTVLPPEQRAAFEASALKTCEGETAGRVRAHLELLAEQLHPRTLAERHHDARENRKVRVLPLADGMSDLCATLPTLLADAIYDRVTQQARCIVDERALAAAELREAAATERREATTGAASAATHGSDDAAARELIATDTRTIDQVRSDVLADMLLTASPTADPTRTDDRPGTLGTIRAKVQVVVPALTLLGSDANPADLVGRSPIDPETARHLASATRSPWERVLTHPVTGVVLHVDTYNRTTAIDRFLRARDQHCRFPGCRMPAVRCEVDHTLDHALGGKTDVKNLAHLCQRHHSMKQFTAWCVKQLGDGVLEWISPLGRSYIEDPPTLGVHFRPSLDTETEPDAPGEDPPDIAGAHRWWPVGDSPDNLPDNSPGTAPDSSAGNAPF